MLNNLLWGISEVGSRQICILESGVRLSYPPPIKGTDMKSLIAILSLTLSGTALADQALAQKNMCLACHAVDTKLVGPSYKDVAA